MIRQDEAASTYKKYGGIFYFCFGSSHGILYQPLNEAFSRVDGLQADPSLMQFIGFEVREIRGLYTRRIRTGENSRNGIKHCMNRQKLQLDIL